MSWAGGFAPLLQGAEHFAFSHEAVLDVEVEDGLRLGDEVAVRREKAGRWITWTLPVLVVPGLLALAGHSSNLGFAIGVNLLMAAACVALMFYAVAVRTEVYLNLAIISFLLLVTVRYFDTAWEYLPRSLFFILGGVMLLGIGFLLERKRPDLGLEGSMTLRFQHLHLVA